METKKRAQKKHSGHLKTKRASDYAPYDQGYELENGNSKNLEANSLVNYLIVEGSPLDDGLEDSGDEIRED